MAPHASDSAADGGRSGVWVSVPEQPLFAPKRMRVVTVGAGHAGLMVAYKMRHEVKVESFVDHVIYEKNVRAALGSPISTSSGLIRFCSTMLVEPGWKIVTLVLPVMFRRTSTPSPGNPTQIGAHTTVAARRSGNI